MADLQQRTAAWHIARRGRLTASNLGALLGQVSYTSRAQAYRRILGTDVFIGNAATKWGTEQELQGVMEYMSKTGNVVEATGLHLHPTYPWLAGSPDGFVGTDGMIEVKCPYYRRKDGKSRVHPTVPVHYWIQVNALLEITGRPWCDYVCWAPEGMAIYRVQRDAATFDYLCQFYAAIYAATQMFAEKPPPMSAAQQQQIADRVKLAIQNGVDHTYWSYLVTSAPPCVSDVDSSDMEDWVNADEVCTARKKRRFSPSGTEEAPCNSNVA